MPTQPTQPDTSELDKQSEIIRSGKAAVVQAFYDWLVEEKKFVLHKWETGLTDLRVCDGGAGFLSSPRCDNGKVVRSGVTQDEECQVCEGTGFVTIEVKDQYMPVYARPEDLMAEFFGIDLDKIEAERRVLLDRLRQANRQ